MAGFDRPLTAAQAELKKALKANPFVAASLLAKEEPDALPASYSLGSPEEAAICTAELRPSFAATPGALHWLKAQADQFRRAPQTDAFARNRRDRELRRQRRSHERKRKRR